LEHHKFFTLSADIKPRCLEERINFVVDDSRCFEGLRKYTTAVTFDSSKKIQTFILSITDGLRGTNRLTQRISALTPPVNGSLLRFAKKKKKKKIQYPITKTARANGY
jgi:hypothetical protein